MAVVLALASAVVYGAADFLGGLASRRTSVFGVVAHVAGGRAGRAARAPPLARRPGRRSPTSPGARAAGLAGAAGLVVFFRALAGGVMSVIAPVTAVTAAAVPVLVGLLAGNRIGAWAAAGIALALAAVVLVSAEGGLRALRAARPASLAPGARAGAAFGLFFVLLDRTSDGPRGSPRWSRPGWRRSALVVVVALGGPAVRCGSRGRRCRWWRCPASAT